MANCGKTCGKTGEKLVDWLRINLLIKQSENKIMTNLRKRTTKNTHNLHIKKKDCEKIGRIFQITFTKTTDFHIPYNYYN